jgi:hypothetical protein
MQSTASAALAVAIGLAGTPAQATLTSGPATEAVISAPDGGPSSIAQSHDGRLRVAIQWSGSNGGDDTPTEDHPF